MRKVLTIVLLAAGLAAGAQNKEHRNEFRAQIARTPHLVWEWSDQDSISAYQDTIEGVFKMFYALYDKETKYERYYVYYDWELVLDGTLDKMLYRDWNAFDLDSGFAFTPLYGLNPRIADSLGEFKDTFLGYTWTEPYETTTLDVEREDAFLEKSWGEDGTIYLELVYTKIFGTREDEH